MKRIPFISGNSGRITILAIGVTALSMLVSLVSLYLFMAAGRTMMPGPLAFRIAVSLPGLMPAPAMPLTATLEDTPFFSPGQAVADAGEQVIGLGAQILELQTTTPSLFAMTQPDASLAPDIPVLEPHIPVPAILVPLPDSTDDIADDNSTDDVSWNNGSGSGSSSAKPGLGSGSYASSNSGGQSSGFDQNDPPQKPDKPEKPEKV